MNDDVENVLYTNIMRRFTMSNQEVFPVRMNHIVLTIEIPEDSGKILPKETPMIPVVPMEIVNKIFMYVSSPTAFIIQQSKYYARDLPFLLLRPVILKIVPKNKPSYVECIVDYHNDIYSKIAEYQDPLFQRRIFLFYVYTNYKSRNQSNDLGVDIGEYYDKYSSRILHYYDCAYEPRTGLLCFPVEVMIPISHSNFVLGCTFTSISILLIYIFLIVSL